MSHDQFLTSVGLVSVMFFGVLFAWWSVDPRFKKPKKSKE